MKKIFDVIAAKEVVAEFRIPTYALLPFDGKMYKYVEDLLTRHEEYKDCLWDWEYKNGDLNTKYLSFYSIGNIVEQEVTNNL